MQFGLPSSSGVRLMRPLYARISVPNPMTEPIPSPSPALPGVSVVIPCYNYGVYLREAVDSCLAQQYPGLEVVVVDDGSTDDSAAIAQSYGPPVRCISKPNAGLGAARNTGLEMAVNGLVLLLDADDTLDPGAVHALVEAYMTKTPAPGLVAGRLRHFGPAATGLAPGCDISGDCRRVTLDEALMTTPFSPTVLAERDLLLSLGGFETDFVKFRGSEDKDMWIRVAASGRSMIQLARVIGGYRCHSGSMSGSSVRQSQSSRAVLRKAQQMLGARVSAHQWNRVWAVAYFQAAALHGLAGKNWEAIRYGLLSLARAPVLRDPTMTLRYGSFCRSRVLLMQLWRLLSGRNPHRGA